MAVQLINGYYLTNNICLGSSSFQYKLINAAAVASHTCKALSWASSATSGATNVVLDTSHVSKKLAQTVNVSIWNNKGSQARLNKIQIYCYTASSSTGTLMGTYTFTSNIAKNSTKVVTLSYTLPTTINTTQFLGKIYCGETNVAQKWYYKKIGSSSWTQYTSSGKSAKISGFNIQANSTANSLLGGALSTAQSTFYFEIS